MKPSSKYLISNNKPFKELTARSDKVSPELTKKFLVRILNDNFFEYRVREDASKLMEQDYHQILNIDVLPAEVTDSL